MSSLDKWKQVLNWNVIPEFKSIHSLQEDRFLGCYYVPETVNEFTDKIKNSLIEGYGFNHKTIVGEPGCGKTTFIYFLKSKLKAEQSKLHIEILHIQRMVARDDYKEVIEERVFKILKQYFISNSLSQEFESITKDCNNRKIAINNIEDYIIDNKLRFPKRLIIVIDDVDETKEDIVDKSLRYFYSLVECEQISKWLIARATTLDNYSEGLINFIETKFPQRLVFPKVDLYGVINTRIKHDNPDGTNPFIPELCHSIIATHNNDLRISVANSIAFLENLEPPKTSKNNPEFAGRFFLKNFTKIMTQIKVFPEIYTNSISRTFPIEKDVFLILASNNRFISGNLSTLEKHYRHIYETIHQGAYSEESYLINLTMDHINESIELLSNNRLLSEHKKIPGFYKLTPKGESFVRFINENLYTDYSKKISQLNNERKHPVFWDLAIMHPEYDPEVKRITRESNITTPRDIKRSSRTRQTMH
jgi:DNA polymerase III delta prime subunit